VPGHSAELRVAQIVVNRRLTPCRRACCFAASDKWGHRLMRGVGRQCQRPLAFCNEVWRGPKRRCGNRRAKKLNLLSKGQQRLATRSKGTAMNAIYVRLFFAAVLLVVAATKANAAKPAPVYADVVITYAGQTFGSGGPLRYFDVSEAGGRIGFDLTTLATPGYSPRPNIAPVDLPLAGNRWEVVMFFDHSHETITGTCAAESFSTTEGDTQVQHIYLNCADLDT